jgi:transcriptional regulator with XRE-family HTH domain
MTPEELRRIRDGMGWTQTEAADKVGVTRNTWARWERGEVEPHPLRAPLFERLLRQADRRRERKSA